jgi:hypothetical protein
VVSNGSPWLFAGAARAGEVSCDEEIWHHVWGLHGPGEQAMGMGMGMDMDMDMHGCAWQQKTGGGGAVVPG